MTTKTLTVSEARNAVADAFDAWIQVKSQTLWRNVTKAIAACKAIEGCLTKNRGDMKTGTTYKEEQVKSAMRRLREAVASGADRLDISQLGTDALVVGATRKAVERAMSR